MTPDEIEAHFTRSDGSYRFARWGRPMAPVVFGTDDATLATAKGAVEAVAALAGIEVAETDPELGANLMLFFVADWAELPAVPNLGRLVPDLDALVARLAAGDAGRYTLFRFDEAGAIRAAFAFLRIAGDSARQPAATLLLGLMAEIVLLWSDTAFATRSPLALTPSGTAVLRPEIAGLIRAAYDPVMPAAATDPSHALRLAARMGHAA